MSQSERLGRTVRPSCLLQQDTTQYETRDSEIDQQSTNIDDRRDERSRSAGRIELESPQYERKESAEDGSPKYNARKAESHRYGKSNRISAIDFANGLPKQNSNNADTSEYKTEHPPKRQFPLQHNPPIT